jgi:hypothetical protein
MPEHATRFAVAACGSNLQAWALHEIDLHVQVCLFVHVDADVGMCAGCGGVGDRAGLCNPNITGAE